MTQNGAYSARNDVPISEQFRIAALEWVELDSAARVLEDSKSAIVSQWINDFGDVPVSRAEARVKASDEYLRLIENIANARTEANKAKVQVEYLRMRFSEQIGHDATARLERRM